MRNTIFAGSIKKLFKKEKMNLWNRRFIINMGQFWVSMLFMSEVFTRDISRVSKGHGAFFLKRALASRKGHLARPQQCFRDTSKVQGGFFWTLIVTQHHEMSRFVHLRKRKKFFPWYWYVLDILLSIQYFKWIVFLLGIVCKFTGFTPKMVNKYWRFQKLPKCTQELFLAHDAKSDAHVVGHYWWGHLSTLACRWTHIRNYVVHTYIQYMMHTSYSSFCVYFI
jgi:hypothetical protein